MEITIALAQMAIALGRPQENLQMAQELATQAAARGADLLLLPELWATGYDLASASEYAATLDSGHFSLMASLAQEHQLYVAGTALEANPGGKPFNTAALFAPDGTRLVPTEKCISGLPWARSSTLPPARLCRPLTFSGVAWRWPFAMTCASQNSGAILLMPERSLSSSPLSGPSAG